MTQEDFKLIRVILCLVIFGFTFGWLFRNADYNQLKQQCSVVGVVK